MFAGFVAAALTAATLAVTVLVPAALDVQRDDATITAAGGEDHVYANTGPLTTKIDVLAHRGKRAQGIVQSRADVRAGAAS